MCVPQYQRGSLGSLKEEGDSLEIEIGGRDPWQLLPRNVFSVWIWNICPVSIEQTNTAVHCIQGRMKLNVVGDQRPIIQVSIK